jgi:tRNA (guanine-N7-)-methyltransferase
MYELILHESIVDVYASTGITKELEIKTHYEKLDIARSQRVYYLCFSLPDTALPSMDHILHERIKKNAKQTG